MIRILLVEDNPGDALLVREGLAAAQGAEFVFTGAGSVSEAEALAVQVSVDLILLDLSLPDSRGLETLRRVLDAWRGTPIVVLTGLDDDAMGDALLRAGAQDYVVKDEISERRLGRSIRFAIRRSQQRDPGALWAAQFSAAIDSSRDAMWEWDLSQNRFRYSPGWWAAMGLERRVPPHTPEVWLERVVPDDAARLAAALQRLMDGSARGFDLDYRVRHGAGRVCWMRAHAFLVRDAAGHPSWIAGSQVDITGQLDNPCGVCGHQSSRAATICDCCGAHLVASQSSGVEVDSSGDGVVLGDTFRLGALIGRGATGAVYEARHIDTDVACAVKVLHPWLLEDPIARERFFSEASLQAGLRHPHIVRVHDFGITDAGGWIALDLCAGPDLRAFSMSSNAPHDPAALVGLFIPVIEAVGAAHALGIVHRDIKPENVLVTQGREGLRLRLTDFGVAKAPGVEHRTRTGAMLGTLQYMAPEQFVDSASADARADIYALGCTLYELLTRRPPFLFETEFRMMAAHLTEIPESPRVFNPLVSPALAGEILRALAKAPSDRHASCTELVAALRLAVA